jgi:hypothetical protein
MKILILTLIMIILVISKCHIEESKKLIFLDTTENEGCYMFAKGRGTGIPAHGDPLSCSENENLWRGFCYSACEDSELYGIGPMCWSECPHGYHYCEILCQKTESCTSEMKEYMIGVIDSVEAFAIANPTKGIIDISKFAKDYNYPTCSK